MAHNPIPIFALLLSFFFPLFRCLFVTHSPILYIRASEQPSVTLKYHKYRVTHKNLIPFIQYIV